MRSEDRKQLSALDAAIIAARKALEDALMARRIFVSTLEREGR